MVNVINYIEKKSKGLAEVVKAGGGYAIAIKKFDSETGELDSPEIQAVGIDGIDAEIVSKQAEIDDLNTLKKDINSLTV